MGQVDVLEQLDWSKLRWNIDGDDVTANDVTFTKDDFSAAVLSGGEIVATLTQGAADKKKEVLENTPGAGFEDVAGDAATNAQDDIEISAGFIRDNGLNASDATYDADATYTKGGNPIATPTIVSIQSDTGTTPTLYGRYEADGSTPKTITISATMSTEVIKGSAMTIKLNTGNSSLGTATLTADATGTVMSGTYTVREGDDTSSLALSTGSDANAPIQLLTSSSQFIVDEYGNSIQGSDLVPPAGQSLADLSNITIDAAPPDVTITGVSYDITDGTITISGTGFTEAEMGQVDVLEQLDWSKLRWNIDGDDVTANDVTFTKDDFSAAVLSGGEIVATLTQGAADKKKEVLENTPGAGFEDVAGDAATNAQDDIEISAGFIRDNGLNASDATYDADATYTKGGNPIATPTIVSIQSDAGATPVAFAHINPSTSSANVINISATMSTEVIAGSSMTIKLATNNAAGLGTATLTAGTTGTTMSGTYTVRDGDNVTDLALNTAGTGSAAPIQLLTSSSQFISDVFGTQIQGSDLVPPAGQSLADTGTIRIDTSGPDVTINQLVQYNVTNGKFTISGTGFNTIETAANNSVKDQLDWSKFVWDIDSDGSGTPSDTRVTFEASDFVSVVVSSNTIVAELTSGKDDGTTKKEVLEKTAGFGFDDAAGSATANVQDQIDITAGFIRDDLLNPATSDGGSRTISYSDLAMPQIQGLMAIEVDGNGNIVMQGSDPKPLADGAYNAGDKMVIAAQLSETVLKGSAITATLDTGAKIRLVADADQDYLVGSYTVQATDLDSADLKVDTLSLTNADGGSDFIADIYGNSVVGPNVDIPLVQAGVAGTGNISDNQNIEIDNLILSPIPPVVSGVSTVDVGNAGGDSALAAGEDLVVAFNDSVSSNSKTIVTSALSNNSALFGTSAAAAWTANTDGKADTILTITLGDSPTIVDGSTFTFTGLTDDAGNGTSPSDLVFSVDIT